MEGRGTLTVGIPHKTRGRALVFGVVWAKGDCYPATSWNLARPVGVLYALQKPKPKGKKLFGAGLYLLSLEGRHTSVFQSRALFARCPVCESDEMMEVEVRKRQLTEKTPSTNHETLSAVGGCLVHRAHMKRAGQVMEPVICRESDFETWRMGRHFQRKRFGRQMTK